jgi:predicted metal-dependent HD superfamily phosphohydrolase
MSDLDDLTRNWHCCWRDLQIDAAASDRVLQLLITAYTQPDRHYHNLTHIRQVLKTLARFSQQLQQPTAVYLAAWFHDVCYDSQSADNELQSAKIAARWLEPLGLSANLIDRISELILATRGHHIDLRDRDGWLLLDADLAILGAEPAAYRGYQQSIRQEYLWVADADYRSGRIRVLTSFLHRERLYRTDLLFNELEAIARANIDREICQLERDRS